MALPKYHAFSVSKFKYIKDCNTSKYRAVFDTVEHVNLITTDCSVRGTAAGLLISINNVTFLLCLELLTPLWKLSIM